MSFSRILGVKHYYSYLHFTGEEIEARRGLIIDNTANRITDPAF